MGFECLQKWGLQHLSGQCSAMHTQNLTQHCIVADCSCDVKLSPALLFSLPTQFQELHLQLSILGSAPTPSYVCPAQLHLCNMCAACVWHMDGIWVVCGLQSLRGKLPLTGTVSLEEYIFSHAFPVPSSFPFHQISLFDYSSHDSFIVSICVSCP